MLSAQLRCRRNQQSQALRAQADAMRAAAKAYDPGRHDGGAGGGAAATRVRGQPSESHVEAKAREREQELIRRNYLGKPHEKRRITKASDKFKCGASLSLSQSTHARPVLNVAARLYGPVVLAHTCARARVRVVTGSTPTL